MQRFVVPLVCLLALMALVPASATKTVSCITVPACISPDYSYAVYLNTTDNGVCCSLCADDKKCVAWTREWSTGNCYLKDDTDVLIKLWNVDSGLKCETEYVPTLEHNPLNATIIVAKYYEPAPVKPKKRTSVSVSVSASASGRSGPSRASARAHATPTTFSSSSSVSGTGSAYTSVENTRIKFASAVTKKRGELPKYAVAYYEKPKALVELKTVTDKVVPFVIPKNTEPSCHVCPGVPCLYNTNISYHDGGDVLLIQELDYAELCCQACRNHLDCLSWYWNPYNKQCVLNKNCPYPQYYEDSKLVGGTAV